MQNYHAQRVWDRRAEAYSAIFGALDGMHLWFVKNVVDIERNDQPSPQEETSRRTTFQTQRTALSQLLARETWVIPERTQNIIAKLFKALDPDETVLWSDLILNGDTAFREAITTLKQAARDDLGVQ